MNRPAWTLRSVAPSVVVFLLNFLLPPSPGSPQDRILISSADYNGDGNADLAAFHPATGLWAVRGWSRFYFGAEGDLPACGDFNGDGTGDVSIFRPESFLWAIKDLTRAAFGAAGDVPAPADYDGDGRDEIAVFRPDNCLWAIRGGIRAYFGSPGDLPAPADYDGAGGAEIAVFRPQGGLWAARNLSRWYWGQSGDIPLPAPWAAEAGDGAAIFRPSSALWAIRGISRFHFGASTDWAFPFHAAQDGARPGLYRDNETLWAIRGVTRTVFGNRGSYPAAGSAGRVLHLRLEDVRHFAYNIMNVNTPEQWEELVGTHFDMYVLEPVVTENGEESFDIAGLVKAIRDYNIAAYHKNPIILAYADVGQAEDWRWYWQSGWGVGNPTWIVSADPDGWEGCYPVAYWYPEWENIVIYGYAGKSQVEVSLEAGFDGIYLDWIDGFSDEQVVARAEAEGIDPAVAMFDFIEKIRDYARSGSPRSNAGYLVIAQNAPGLYGENPGRYLSLIDAISQEGIWYEGDGGFDDWNDPRGYNVPTNEIYPGWTEELLAYLSPMKGKLPIFCIEYAQDLDGANRATEVYSTLAPAEGFIPYCTRRLLSRLSTTPYPAGYYPYDY